MKCKTNLLVWTTFITFEPSVTVLTLQALCEQIQKVGQIRYAKIIDAADRTIQIQCKRGRTPQQLIALEATFKRIVKGQKILPDPLPGEMVYVPDTDITRGGLAKIKAVEPGISAGKKVPFVRLEGIPFHTFNLASLLEEQQEYRQRYGNQRAARF